MEACRDVKGEMAICVLLVVVGCLAVPDDLYGELSLYLDGEPAGSTAGGLYGEPLPQLGIHSDSTDAWHGYVRSSEYHLINGQIEEDSVEVTFGHLLKRFFSAHRGLDHHSTGGEPLSQSLCEFLFVVNQQHTVISHDPSSTAPTKGLIQGEYYLFF